MLLLLLLELPPEIFEFPVPIALQLPLDIRKVSQDFLGLQYALLVPDVVGVRLLQLGIRVPAALGSSERLLALSHGFHIVGEWVLHAQNVLSLINIDYLADLGRRVVPGRGGVIHILR